MFRSNDKITLSLINAKKIDGKTIPFSLKMPITDEEYDIPSDVCSIDVFEYQEGSVNLGYVCFHIYIGKNARFEELIKRNGNKNICIREKLDIPTIDSDVCYQNIGNDIIIFATLDKQDIVVDENEQLRDVVRRLSRDYEFFSRAVDTIKVFSKKENERR